MRVETASTLSLGSAGLLAVAAAAGLWARLSGFGQRGLAVDEYFFLRGSLSILDHGAPRLLDGGYYVVGLIPQYLTAASIALLGPSDAALRLPALLAGLALPALAYRYVRGHASPALAAAVAAALLVSSWQIEFSRFGRMYTALACATLLFLTRFDRSLVGPEWGRRYWAHAWAAVAALCHAEGVLLAPLLFAPLLDAGRFPRKGDYLRYASWTLAVVAVLAAFAVFDFRRFGVTDLYPAAYTPPGGGALRLPAAPLWALGLSPASSLALIAGTLVASGVWALVRIRAKTLDEPAALALLGCVAGLLHQLTLAGLLAGVLVLRSARGIARASLLRRLFGIAACSVLWPVIALTIGAVSSPGGLRRLFFSWPQIYEAWCVPWSVDLPWLGSAIAGAIAFSLWQDRTRPWLEILGSPAGIIAYAVLSLGLLQYFYESTRYHYFLYAVMLAAVATACARLLGPTLGAGAFLVLFVLGGDFDPAHISTAGGEEVAFRIGRFAGRAGLWYPRSDYRAAAAALARLDDGAANIVIGTCAPLAEYFEGEHVRYLDRAEFPFWEQSRRRGTVELWTGRTLLGTVEELRLWSAGKQEVFLVRRAPADLRELDPATIWRDRLVTAEREFVSRDGGVDIVRVSLALQPGSPKQ